MERLILKKVLFVIILIFLYCIFNFYSYGGDYEYGDPGYWTEQYNAWKSVDNLYARRASATATGNQDLAIFGNVYTQTISHLNNTKGNTDGKSDRASYLKLIKKMSANVGSSKSGLSAKEQENEIDKLKKIYNQIKANKTICQKEPELIKEIEKNLKISKNNNDSEKEIENAQHSGETVSNEQSQEWANTSSEAETSSNEEQIEDLNILKLPERNLGYYSKSNKVNETTADELISDADDFIKSGDNTNTINQSKLSKTVKSLYNILLAISIVLAVIVGTYLAIKVMISSVEEKAKIKELFIPYVIGCIVAFGAFGIWALVMKVFNSM